MIRWNNTQRAWKKAADEAIATHRLGDERDRLAAEVAKRVWVANGGREWADVRGEGSLLALEALLARHLHDGLVRASAALRYVSVMEESCRTADYEDSRSLEAERRWAEHYLQGPMQCAVVVSGGELPDSALRESAEERMERLRAGLAALLTADLKAASIAAA